MATVENFGDTSGKFNIARICTSGNYAQIWIINEYTYSFVLLVSLTK
jgi:hypothetical protein